MSVWTFCCIRCYVSFCVPTPKTNSRICKLFSLLFFFVISQTKHGLQFTKDTIQPSPRRKMGRKDSGNSLSCWTVGTVSFFPNLMFIIILNRLNCKLIYLYINIYILHFFLHFFTRIFLYFYSLIK